MTCDDTRALLPEVLTGGVADDRRAALEAHLASCVACRREADEISRALALVRASAPPAGPVEPPAFDDVLAAVRAPSRRASVWLARAAALLLAALAGFGADRALRPRETPVAIQTPAKRIEKARAQIAGKPGDLGSSLALLGALSGKK
jgi:anti-sigma factor RsiW